jgi:hypothetical protein
MGALDMPETRAASFLTADELAAGGQAIRRFSVDFAAGLLVFAVCAGLFSIGASNAFPAPPPPELSLVSALLPPPTMIVTIPAFPGELQGPGPFQTLTLLAFAFASLVATNMAIGRHLLSAYASPRRRGWRKG